MVGSSGGHNEEMLKMTLGHRIALPAAALALALFAGPALAQMQTFKADLKGSEEVPPNTSSGSGTITATFDPASKQLSWEGTVTGLSGNATAAHFHGPAEKGKNAGILVPAPGVTTGAFKGQATLTDAQVQALTGGMTYFNVHTQANPGGELRGQVTKQ
jgi:hypothetical protein